MSEHDHEHDPEEPGLDPHTLEQHTLEQHTLEQHGEEGDDEEEHSGGDDT